MPALWGRKVMVNGESAKMGPVRPGETRRGQGVQSAAAPAAEGVRPLLPRSRSGPDQQRGTVIGFFGMKAAGRGSTQQIIIAVRLSRFSQECRSRQRHADIPGAGRTTFIEMIHYVVKTADLNDAGLYAWLALGSL